MHPIGIMIPYFGFKNNFEQSHCMQGKLTGIFFSRLYMRGIKTDKTDTQMLEHLKQGKGAENAC